MVPPLQDVRVKVWKTFKTTGEVTSVTLLLLPPEFTCLARQSTK